jgi:Flp pilus assembly protein TadD
MMGADKPSQGGWMMTAGRVLMTALAAIAALGATAHGQVPRERSPALLGAIEECESGALTLTNGARALGACDFALRSELLGENERARLLVNRAALSIDRGALSSARTDLEQAEQAMPDLPELHLNLSALRIREGNFTGAQRAAERALELGLRPEALGHFNRAIALERQNRSAEALSAYREAARLAPGHAEIAAQPGRFNLAGS